MTEALGLAPTRTWSAGDVVAPKSVATRRYKDNGWELKVSHHRGTELTKHLESLIARLERSRFKAIRKNADAYLECEIYDYEFRRTDLSLSRKAISGLSDLGLEVDIDYYDLSHGNGEE
jgi:hypothetical protein